MFCIILLSAIENVMAQGHLISLSKLKNEIIYIYDFGIFKGEEYVYDRFPIGIKVYEDGRTEDYK